MTAVHEQRRLGRTSLSATTLGLGTTAIGGLYTATSEDSAEETMQTAWDLGVRFFDTAPQYGNGMAEQRLGAFLRKSRAIVTFCARKLADCSASPKTRKAKTHITKARHRSGRCLTSAMTASCAPSRTA